MLRRFVVVLVIVVLISLKVTKAIYDPSDDEPAKPTKNTNHLHLHHNYSRVRVQRPISPPPNNNQPIYNAHSYGSRQESERLTTQTGDLIRVKRNKTKIEVYSKCPKGATGQLVFELSCNQFLNCWKGRGVVQNCAPGTLFNPKTLECDHAEKVQCVTGPRQSMLLHHHERIAQETQPGCPGDFSGIIPHYTDCSKFINCDRGVENVMDCPPGTLFDVNSNLCDYEYKAHCVNRENVVRVTRPEYSNYEDGTHSEQNLGTRSGENRYTPNHQGVGTNFSNQYYDQSSQSHLNHRSRPVHNYQTSSSNRGRENYDQNLETLEASRQNIQGQQSHESRASQNFGSSYQASSGNYGQVNYDQNLDSLDQNLQSSFSAAANTRKLKNQRYELTHNLATNNQGFSNDQNFETHDQTFESGSNIDNQRYRPSQFVSNRPEHSNYDQNLELSSSSGSYSHAHQVNAFRPSQNFGASQQSSLGGNYNSASYDQNLESSASDGGYQSSSNVRTNIYKPYDGTSYRPQSSSGRYDHNLEATSQYGRREEQRYHLQEQAATKIDQNRAEYEAPKCPEGGAGLYQHPWDCSKFLSCANGITYIQDCAPGTVFNPLLKVCDFPYNVQCGQQEVDAVRSDDQQNNNKPLYWVASSTTEESTRNVGGYEESIYHQQNNNYGHRPSGNWNALPSNSRQNTYEQTIYDQQNKNYEHRPPGNWNYSRPSSSRQNRHEESVYDQPNRNYRHRLNTGNWNHTRPVDPVENYEDQNGSFGHWIAVNDTSFSSTSRPGFYLTRPPQVVHTPKPNREEGVIVQQTTGDAYNRNSRWVETPDVDYVYEYDDDIIVDAQPAASNKKPQEVKGVCRSGQYTCPDNQCIPSSTVCDGLQDCIGGNDEINCDISRFTLTKNNKLAVAEKKKLSNTTMSSCAKYCLDETAFECRAFNFRKHDGVCYLLDRNIGLSGALIIYQIFDYYELTTTTIDCTNLFRCPNNKCIKYSKLCDGQNDCGDRTDEKHCSAHAIGYSIRLAGSENSNEGRIEVTALGRTGYVCDDQFGMRDAEVVCRELGFDLGALEVRGNSYYAKELGNNTFYLMDDVSCSGNETTLRDCDFSGWGVHNCMAQEVVGVVCKTPEEKCKEGYWQCDNERECLPLAFLCDGVYDCTDSSDEADGHCEAPVQLRLANGSSYLEGRVEVKHLGTWGTICDDDFNEDAAKVVCKSLGFEGSAKVRKDGYFGPGKGPIWLDQVFCQGNETSIQDCVHWDWGEHNCDHAEDVGVICSERSGVNQMERRRQEPIVQAPKVEPLQLLPERCGLRKDNIFSQNDEVHFRVVKGSEAKKGDYPWQASIRVKGKSKPTHWCGAVVISQRFVLTAAHCLVGFSKGAYVVVAGDYNVDEDEGSEQLSLIEDFYIHEEFRKGQKMNNDIALVKLKGNGFTITEDIQPICLPEAELVYDNDLNCTISGFGTTKTGKAYYSHELRAGWIPLQSREVCKMPHIYGSSITQGMICAGFLDEGVDACDGDSGGPLACLHEGVFTLFGLTSWGQHCGYANKPGVYVKLSHYRYWIEEKMNKYA